MTSKLKSETARINGAKSKGPKTPETRAKSAQNSIKHGLTAVNTILLGCESEDEFNNLLANFVAMHLPVGAAEQDTVEQMALARWRVRRISTAETALVDVEMARRKPETEKEFPDADPGVHLGLALKALSDDSRSLALFSRYKFAALPPAWRHHQDQTVRRSISPVHRLSRRDCRLAPLPGTIHDPPRSAAQHLNLLLIRIKSQSLPHKIDDIFRAIQACRSSQNERAWDQYSRRSAWTPYPILQ